MLAGRQSAAAITDKVSSEKSTHSLNGVRMVVRILFLLLHNCFAWRDLARVVLNYILQTNFVLPCVFCGET